MSLSLTRVVPAAIAAGALLFSGPAVVNGSAGQQLPDLDPETPAQLTILPTGTAGGHVHWVLGFSAAASNIGAGPLTITGNRPNTSTPAMTAHQIISGDTEQVVPDVGEMRYVVSPTHNHWHLLHFMRYELRRAGSKNAVVRDRKSGFCLGDRYRASAPSLGAAPPQPVVTGHCGLYEPELLSVSEGISVGYGDIYAAYVEFQDLPLDGLRNGRYVLVHTVNPDGRLHELSKTNNSSSVLLGIHWHGETPNVVLLRECPETAECAMPHRKRARTAASESRAGALAAGLANSGTVVPVSNRRALLARQLPVQLIVSASQLRHDPFVLTCRPR
jgi:Lysyl oxidase